jgi:hypothetical protein
MTAPRRLSATAYRSRGPQQHHPTGSPATDAKIPSASRSGGPGLEATPIATTKPTSGELTTGRAKRHTPAAASSPLTVEQTREIRELTQTHRPSLDIRAHEREASASGTG